MTVQEMLELIRNPPESGVPENLFDELATEVLTREQRDRDALEGAQARITELETTVQTHASELQRVKATNFDLLMSSGASGGDDKNTPNGDTTDTPELTGIDSLFE